MQTVLPLVVYGATAVYVLAGLLSMFSRHNLYDQIGQGGLTVNEDRRLRGSDLREPLEPPTARAEREREIRQMLQARSDRLVRQGHPPLDIDAKLATLESTEGKPEAHDAALQEEVRQLVIASNERRQRQGLHPLDVDTEMRRSLAELNP
jgi:hypothetical protein